MTRERAYEIILIGSSAGGLHAATQLFSSLPAHFTLPLIFVQHRSKGQGQLLEEILQEGCSIRIKQADEKEKVLSSTIYVAPPDYHLLIEPDRTFSLSAESPVNFSRPSIDVLFESAAQVYAAKAVGIVLTGSNNDGARGLATIKRWGGLTIAQDPDEAEYPEMPIAAIQTRQVDHVLTLNEIKKLLMELSV